VIGCSLNEEHNQHHRDREKPETDHTNRKRRFIFENLRETPMHFAMSLSWEIPPFATEACTR
jgi:hypothetical protein